MRFKGKGFTMVELLVVLIIVGILAVVAVPIYLANANRARASEAVATMGLIRQALRDYRVAHASYFDIASGNIDNPLPTSVSSGVPTPADAGVGINVGVTQYFSNAAFVVTVNGRSWNSAIVPGDPTDPVDFVITANGDTPPNVACAGGSVDCAVRNTDVDRYRLQMDNSGRTFVSYDSGNNWTVW